MSEKVQEIIKMHPCFSFEPHFNVGRVHLAVAPKCNISCRYCKQQIGSSYNFYRPAVASKVLSPQEALQRVASLASFPWLKVAGIAGPGEPLYNKETFETLELVHENFPSLLLCLCTNGLLLPRYVEELVRLHVKAITVTANAISPVNAAKIYSRIHHQGREIYGRQASRILVRNQIKGIALASRMGLLVKVNTVFIPTVNDQELIKVALEAKKQGAYLQNIMPLIPCAQFKQIKPPSCKELRRARDSCEEIIPQFRLCKQCRADSIGIPGLESYSHNSCMHS